jgi:outer membrane protein TolC
MMIAVLARIRDRYESGRGQPNCKTSRKVWCARKRASVLECGCPLPLFCLPKLRQLALRFLACGLAINLWIARAIAAQGSNAVHEIDLPTTLRLAGAQNLDVQIARERLAEAKANHAAAVAQFFPWISPSFIYRQHDDKLQDSPGNIIDVHKYSYEPGALLAARVDVGDALYKSLAAKQLVKAADHALDAQRQDTVIAAAQGYYELAFAQGAVGVAKESLRINSDNEQQIGHAVDAGIAFKGDALRVTVQKQRSQLTLHQAMEQQRVSAARLAQVLHLDPSVELVALDADLAPLALIGTNAGLDSFVQQSLTQRPELKQNQALLRASREANNGAVYGPLIPTVGAQGFFGGLGGGRSGVGDTFGAQEDYAIGVSWRIGPGGLFDFTRTRATESRVKISELTLGKLHDDVTRQVVEAFTHWQSLNDQLNVAKQALQAAEEALRLAQQRKEFAVGIVLENIQAEQDLTRARLDYLKTVADFDRAQYALLKAIGKL